MLELRQITKTLNQQVIFEHLDLKIEGPIMLGISGVSGAGKTTLLNIIGGLDEDYQGAVRFNGVNIKKNLTAYRLHHVCFLYQQYALLSKWSVKDNLSLHDYLSHQQSSVNVQELLNKLNLNEKTNKKCGLLSGGQQQRYALIRGLKKEPSIILCDEPTSALDKENAQHLMSLLKEYAKNTIVIVVSHDHFLLNQYCDKILHLHNGQLDQTHLSSNRRLKIKTKIKRRLAIVDYLILLKETFKSQRERHLLACFSIMFATFCLMLTLVIGYCLKQETFKEIKKLFPQQCISLKKQNRDWLNKENAEELVNASDINGAYLNIPYIEFLGLAKENEDILFIGDNTRCVNDELSLNYGRFPNNDKEILLSFNTYQRLFGDEMKNQIILGYYQYQGIQKRVSLEVVGIVNEYTSMDTIYRNSLSEIVLLEQLFEIPEITGDYILLYCQNQVKKTITFYEEHFPMYDYKEVGLDFTKQVETLLQKISYFLYALTLVMIVSVVLLLTMTIYLNITEKIREIGLFRMMGASTKQITYLQLLDITLISLVGSGLGVLMVSFMLKQINGIITQTLGFSLLKSLPIELNILIVLLMCGLGLLSSIFPVRLLAKLSLVNCLKDQGY